MLAGAGGGGVEDAGTVLRDAMTAERQAIEALERAITDYLDGTTTPADWRQLSGQLRTSQQQVHESMEFWEAVVEAGSYGK
jgi:hypothetical protein